MDIHIGKIIQSTLKNQGISVVSFANQINCTRRNLYEIFKKDHIDTALLQIISEKLSVNLFLNFLTEQDLIHQQQSSLSIQLNEMIIKLQKGEEKNLK